MNYIYHFLPDNMQGNILYPLNEMKTIYPDLYDKEVKKYVNREQLLEKEIPGLNCKWNDVIFFSTVPPKVIKDFIGKFGYGARISWKYYQIPIEDLDQDKVLIWLGSSSNIMSKDKVLNTSSYDRTLFSNFSEMTEANKEYLTEVLSKKGQVFNLFAGAIHVFYKGSLDVSKYPIISLEK